MPSVKAVIDSSVIVKWLSQDNEDHITQADKLLKQAYAGKVKLVIPVLASYEVGNVLLKSKGLSYSQASILLKILFSLPIEFVALSEELAVQTYEIAERAGITYYDASFLALAQKFNIPLITENIKHQKRTEKVKVIPISDYS